MACASLSGARPGCNLRGLQRERVWRLQQSGLRGAARQVLLVQGDRCRGIQRALAMYCRKVVAIEQRLHLLGRHPAVVRTVAAAARRQVGLRVLSQRERRQNQRKAEDGQQCEAEESAHGSSVAENSLTRRRISGHVIDNRTSLLRWDE